jgi:hypothetical protein
VAAARDAKVPLRGKMGTAWDVANAALFASDEANFIPAWRPVDGGALVRLGGSDTTRFADGPDRSYVMDMPEDISISDSAAPRRRAMALAAQGCWASFGQHLAMGHTAPPFSR